MPDAGLRMADVRAAAGRTGPGHARRGARRGPGPAGRRRADLAAGRNGWPGSGAPRPPCRSGSAPNATGGSPRSTPGTPPGSPAGPAGRRGGRGGRRPGAAGAAGSRWRPTPAGRAEPPGALRVGTVRLAGAEPVPGAGAAARRRARRTSPATTAPAATRWSPALLLRALGRRRPGAVRLIGYDPEQLGGGLAGFAPLATGRPAHLRRPGRPGPAARRPGRADPPDQRDGARRRVRARCASWPRRPAAGRSRGGWRCCSAGRTELSRHERGQLDRVVRTGAACGVHLVVRRSSTLPRRSDASTPGRGRGASGAPARRLDRRAAGHASTPPPPAALVTEPAGQIADAGRPPARRRRRFADLLPPPSDVAGGLGRTALTAPIGEGTARPAGAADARRRPAARADRRPVRHRQDQPDLRLDRRAGRPLLPRRAGVLPARLQGGRVLRPVRAGPARPELAAARAAGRRQRQHRPRVRPGAAALPRRGAAPPGRRGQAARGDQAGRAARRGPGRALAADRRRDRRVPGAARRPGRGRRARPSTCWRTWPGGAARRASTWCWPARTCAGIEALWGRSGAGRASSPCGSRCPRRGGSSPRRNLAAEPIPRYHAVVNADSGRGRGATRSSACPTASDRATWSELQHTAVAAAARRRSRRRGSSTATRCPGCRRPDFRRSRPPDDRAAQRRWRCSARLIDVAARPAALRLPRAPGPQPGGARHPGRRGLRGARAAARSLAGQHRPAPPGSPSPAWTPDAGPAARALHAELRRRHRLVRPGRRRRPDGRDRPTSSARPAQPADRRTTCCCTPSTRPPAAGRRLGRRPGWSSCARSCTTGRSGAPTCWLVAGRGPAARRPRRAGARTDPIGAWVALDVHGGELARRSTRAPAARTGIPARGGGSSSTARCTAPEGDHPLWTVTMNEPVDQRDVRGAAAPAGRADRPGAPPSGPRRTPGTSSSAPPPSGPSPRPPSSVRRRRAGGRSPPGASWSGSTPRWRHLWQSSRSRLGAGAGSATRRRRRRRAPPATRCRCCAGVRDLLDRTGQPRRAAGRRSTRCWRSAGWPAAVAGVRARRRRPGGSATGTAATWRSGLPVLALVVTLLGPVVGLAPAQAAGRPPARACSAPDRSRSCWSPGC